MAACPFNGFRASVFLGPIGSRHEVRPFRHASLLRRPGLEAPCDLAVGPRRGGEPNAWARVAFSDLDGDRLATIRPRDQRYRPFTCELRLYPHVFDVPIADFHILLERPMHSQRLIPQLNIADGEEHEECANQKRGRDGSRRGDNHPKGDVARPVRKIVWVIRSDGCAYQGEYDHHQKERVPA